jgi:DNA-directed RNA polymerase specialized sigma24 family protein
VFVEHLALLTLRETEWQAWYSHCAQPRKIDEETMEPRGTDSYGQWIIRKVQQEVGGHASCLPARVITAASTVWPRVGALVASELRREGSIREAEAVAAEIWEGVLRSVAKVVQRNGSFASAIRDPEAYLLVAFQHRFHRLQKAERGRRDRFQSASLNLDLGLVESARDTNWVLELERSMTVRQITDRMDPWTRKAWQTGQFGYSWKEIAAWAGLSEQAAKKKFEYGLEKTRQRTLRLLKGKKPNEPV